MNENRKINEVGNKDTTQRINKDKLLFEKIERLLNLRALDRVFLIQKEEKKSR